MYIYLFHLLPHSFFTLNNLFCSGVSSEDYPYNQGIHSANLVESFLFESKILALVNRFDFNCGI